MIPSTRTSRKSPRPTPAERSLQTRFRKASVPLALLVGALLLGGCTSVSTFGGFRGATVQGHDTFKLWQGLVLAGLIVAAIVYALIVWSALAYRRKSDDHFPHQFHSNTLIEVVYTVIPIIMVFGIFYVTVLTENNVDAVAKSPSEIVHVLAYRWGFQFTYSAGTGASQGVLIKTAAQPALLAQPATSAEYPQLVLPEGETVRIVLDAADVVHGFYVPQFNFDRYAQPGVTNVFDFTPTQTGVFSGQCTQYCGLYHSEMLFSVKVETPAAFQQWLSATQASQAQGAA